jgi:hypothetical protein
VILNQWHSFGIQSYKQRKPESYTIGLGSLIFEFLIKNFRPVPFIDCRVSCKECVLLFKQASLLLEEGDICVN